MDLYFFDFDRTLCSHAYPALGLKTNHGLSEDAEMFLRELTCMDTLSRGDRPSEAMKWYIKNLKGPYLLNCLTHQYSNLNNERNIKFLKDNYDCRFNYITVSKPEQKIDMIQAIAMSQDVPLKNCYLIEDRMETVHFAIESGINAIHISSIYDDYIEFLKGDK